MINIELIDSFKKERFVIFNTVAGISIMGTIMEEMPESFIIALPARLVRQKNTLNAEPYLPEKLARFYKSTLLNHVKLSGDFELPYLTYFLDNSEDLGIGDKELEYLEERVQELLDKSQEEATLVELPPHVNFVFPDSGEVH